MSAPRILVLDDEPGIGQLVNRSLAMGGIEVKAVTESVSLRRAMRQGPVDLVILDLNLRDEDGLDVLRGLRESDQVPVIILTARGEPIDRVVGLELGADDYVTKPFEPRELLARVRVVLRRLGRLRPSDAPSAGEIISFGPWRLDLFARCLTNANDVPVALTSVQFDILSVLATHPNRVLTRDQIFELSRDRGTTPFDRSIDSHISQLRRKIETDPKNPEFIRTVYGAGYIFSGISRGS